MILVVLKHSMIYIKTFIPKEMLIDDAEMKQDKFDAKLSALSGYSPKNKNILR